MNDHDNVANNVELVVRSHMRAAPFEASFLWSGFMNTIASSGLKALLENTVSLPSLVNQILSVNAIGFGATLLPLFANIPKLGSCTGCSLAAHRERSIHPSLAVKVLSSD